LTKQAGFHGLPFDFMKSLFVVAGEVSGDTHGAGVLAEVLARHPGVEVHGLGGPRLRALAGPGLDDWVGEAAVLG